MSYQTPDDAAAALECRKAAEAVGAGLDTVRRRPTSSLHPRQENYFPKFRANDLVPGLRPHRLELEATVDKNEVYALFPSQGPPHPDSRFRCGMCRRPLRWQSDLPSRCEEPSCQAVNVGIDWAVNEKYRQLETGRRQQELMNKDTKNYFGQDVKHYEWNGRQKASPEALTDPVRWDDFMNMDALDCDGKAEGASSANGKHPCGAPPSGISNWSDARTVGGCPAANFENATAGQGEHGFASADSFNADTFDFTEELKSARFEDWAGENAAATAPEVTSDSTVEPRQGRPSFGFSSSPVSTFNQTGSGSGSGSRLPLAAAFSPVTPPSSSVYDAGPDLDTLYDHSPKSATSHNMRYYLHDKDAPGTPTPGSRYRMSRNRNANFAFTNVASDLQAPTYTIPTIPTTSLQSPFSPGSSKVGNAATSSSPSTWSAQLVVGSHDGIARVHRAQESPSLPTSPTATSPAAKIPVTTSSSTPSEPLHVRRPQP